MDNTYIIEHRPKGLSDQPVLYWTRQQTWTPDREKADIFTNRERLTADFEDGGGVWVPVETGRTRTNE